MTVLVALALLGLEPIEAGQTSAVPQPAPLEELLDIHSLDLLRDKKPEPLPEPPQPNRTRWFRASDGTLLPRSPEGKMWIKGRLTGRHYLVDASWPYYYEFADGVLVRAMRRLNEREYDQWYDLVGQPVKTYTHRAMSPGCFTCPF